mgnify:CR=1 FL=1
MKVLAVCGFGVGSSMVLKMSIEKALRELGIEAEVENTDISTAKASSADVYFTSYELLPDLEAAGKKPVYPIKKYMDVAEIKEQLNHFLGQ